MVAVCSTPQGSVPGVHWVIQRPPKPHRPSIQVPQVKDDLLTAWEAGNVSTEGAPVTLETPQETSLYNTT